MKIYLQKIIIGFFSLLCFLQLSVILASPVSAQGLANPIDTTKPASSNLPIYSGVDGSIQDYLCTPTGKGTDLFDCIGRLQRFGLAFGAIAVVFFIVIAGYIYITGGETAKGKAKGIVFSALTGMAIILGSYVLLSFINPELVKIKTIQPPIFSAAGLPKCEEVGFGEKCVISVGSGSGQVYNPPAGAGGCKNIEQGGCTKANMNACPGMAKNMDLALRICNQESAGGNVAIMSSTDKCQIQGTSEVVSFSGGLWQLNIHNSVDPQLFPECVGVLTHVSPGSHCTVSAPWNDVDCTCKYGSGGKAAYQKCVKALADPVRNIKNGCILFNQKSSRGTEPGIRGWQPWTTSYNKCSKVS